jgi:hypothetical protein
MRSSRLRGALVGVVVAAAIPAAGCTGHRPAGAPRTVSGPPVRRLASEIVLEMVTSRPRLAPPPGTAQRSRCPAGLAAMPGPGADPARCYRVVGRPVRITSAAIALIRQAAGPGSYALAVTVPRDGRRALTAITTRAAGRQLAVIVAGIAWDIAYIEQPVTEGAFEIPLAGKKQARNLMRMLSPSRLLPAPAQTMAGPLAALRLPGRGPLAMWQFHVSQAGRYRPGNRQGRRR